MFEVKSCCSPECWYSEMIGEVFTGFMVPGQPWVFFSERLYFYPQDIVYITDKRINSINLPVFNTGGFKS